MSPGRADPFFLMKCACFQSLPNFLIQAGNKIIQLKEERTLMSRFLIAARKRPELDLEEAIGNYEFSVVPKSLFATDGSPLPSTDKSNVMKEIELLIEQPEVRDDDNEGTPDEPNQNDSNIFEAADGKVGILDGMALVNRLKIDGDVKTWKVSAVCDYLSYCFLLMKLKIKISFTKNICPFFQWIRPSPSGSITITKLLLQQLYSSKISIHFLCRILLLSLLNL